MAAAAEVVEDRALRRDAVLAQAAQRLLDLAHAVLALAHDQERGARGLRHQHAVGHRQHRRRVEQHHVVAPARVLDQLAEARAHQDLGRVRREAAALDEVQLR
jgi:hypothetical protein